MADLNQVQLDEAGGMMGPAIGGFPITKSDSTVFAQARAASAPLTLKCSAKNVACSLWSWK